MAEPKYIRTSSRVYKSVTKSLVCKHCSVAFEHTSNGINPPQYCGDYCRGRVRHKKAKAQPLCVTEGCLNHRHYGNGLCNSCYYRVRRTGTIDKRVNAYRCLTTNGYIKVWDKAHPLAYGKGYVSEHRKVLYDSIGSGPHPCHWCGVAVDWIMMKCTLGSLVPDHLDGNKQNNALSNLVPSCNKCNASRGMFQAWITDHADDPWLWKLYQQYAQKKVA